jgi:hypothetical protein
MAQYPTYEEGYKQGVLDATDVEEFTGARFLQIKGTVVESHFKAIRKKLLVKKVTKWVAIFAGDEIPFFPDSELFDSNPADKFAWCANYIGSYPIKIEVPL